MACSANFKANAARVLRYGLNQNLSARMEMAREGKKATEKLATRQLNEMKRSTNCGHLNFLFTRRQRNGAGKTIGAGGASADKWHDEIYASWCARSMPRSGPTARSRPAKHASLNARNNKPLAEVCTQESSKKNTHSAALFFTVAHQPMGLRRCGFSVLINFMCTIITDFDWRSGCLFRSTPFHPSPF